MARFTAPNVNVSSAVITTTSISFSWSAGSDLTSSYLVYAQRLSNNRDISTDGLTLLQNSTSTTVTVTDLATGATYLFRVRAVSPDGSAISDTDYSFATRSLAGQANVPEGCTFRETLGKGKRKGKGKTQGKGNAGKHGIGWVRAHTDVDVKELD